MTVLKSLTVKVDLSGRKNLEKALKVLKTHSLYIGIPNNDPKNIRPEGHLKNSELGLLMEKGSSDGRIPPRPFLVPGVENQKDAIKKKFKAAAKAALNDDFPAFEQILTQAGTDTADGVRFYMLESSHFVPNAPSTLRRKFPSTKPLIDSGNLKGSIESIMAKD